MPAIPPFWFTPIGGSLITAGWIAGYFAFRGFVVRYATLMSSVARLSTDLVPNVREAFTFIGFNIQVASQCTLFSSLSVFLHFDPNHLFKMSAAEFLHGFAMAWLCFSWDMYFDPGAAALFVQGAADSRGTVLILRKFRDDTRKQMLEEVVPDALSYFGKVTIVETRDEYSRSDRPTIQLQGGMGFLPDWLPRIDYVELLLRAISRLRYTELEWRQNISTQIANARLIVADLSVYSSNISWELHSAFRLSRLDAILSLADDSDAATSAIDSYNLELRAAGHYGMPLVPIRYTPVQSARSLAEYHDLRVAIFKQALSREPPISAFDRVRITVSLTVAVGLAFLVGAMGFGWHWAASLFWALAIVVVVRTLESGWREGR